MQAPWTVENDPHMSDVHRIIDDDVARYEMSDDDALTVWYLGLLAWRKPIRVTRKHGNNKRKPKTD